MTATLPDQPDVVEATEDDLRVAVQHALDYAGLTYEQLAEQARHGTFESVRARLAWVAVGDLARLADGRDGGIRTGGRS